MNRAAKAGKVVQLLSTPKSKIGSNQNIAKLLRSNTRRRLNSKTGTDGVGDAESRANSRHSDANQPLNLRETLAVTHELSEHASRSLQFLDDDEVSPRRRNERLQWKEKVSLPTGWFAIFYH